jgi:hypothetical protein
MEKNIRKDANFKGTGWAAQVLKCIYANKWLTILGPLALGAVVYALFLVFGENPDKVILAWVAPILAAVEYGIVFFVFGFPMRNLFGKPDVMDNAVLFFTVGFAVGIVTTVLPFLADLKMGFTVECVGSCTNLSALALIQSKRK